MKRIFIQSLYIVLSLIFLTPCLQAEEIIYGEDERAEIQDSSVSYLSSYIVAMIDGQKSSKPRTLGESRNLCPEENFYHQPSISKCSGLLIKGKYILTAAHCLSHSSRLSNSACSRKKWMLDYKVGKDGETIEYGETLNCKRVIEFDWRQDYALIEVDKFQKDKVFRPQIDTRIESHFYTALGFPSGLPMKSTTGQLISHDLKHGYFNFDTFKGSSGSPIFNENGELLGLLKFGKSDYIYNKNRGCYESNHCDLYGNSCQVDDEEELKAEGALIIANINSNSELQRILK